MTKDFLPMLPGTTTTTTTDKTFETSAEREHLVAQTVATYVSALIDAEKLSKGVHNAIEARLLKLLKAT